MNQEPWRVVVDEQVTPARVDVYLKAVLPDVSRGYLQGLIRSGSVHLNGHPVKPHRKVRHGDVIAVTFPDPVSTELVPETMALDILHEDKDLLVLNKPAGMVVHPGPGHCTGTLVHGLLAHSKDLSAINGVLRPGIVHRLDKDTSGCLVVAKRDKAHRYLAEQFEQRRVEKEYQAIVLGRLVQPQGVISMRVGRHPVQRKKMAVRAQGREAKTEYRVLEHCGPCTLLSLKPTTGRTHQLRVHLSSMGFPILGDRQYGKAGMPRSHAGGSGEVRAPRQMLHASSLGFTHPASRQFMRWTAEIPPDMQEVLAALRA